MNSSLKIGATAGLVAGSVAGIVGIFAAVMVSSIGLTYFFLPPPIAPIQSIGLNEITLTLIWGVILGAVYSKVYGIVPGKWFAKGLLYGLFCHLIMGVRISSFWYAYTFYSEANAQVIAGFPKWIVYGLALAIFYDFLRRRYAPKEELKIIGYGLRSGVIPGAIGGFVGGIIAWATNFILEFVRFWTPVAGELTWTIEFNIGRLGTHIFIHLMWGVIFGAIFAKVYGLVPGKGIMKGLYYGLIVLLITGFQEGAYFAAYSLVTSVVELSTIMFYVAESFFLTDLFALTVYGLVLGALYKK